MADCVACYEIYLIGIAGINCKFRKVLGQNQPETRVNPVNSPIEP